jgi:hypothetical protein
MNVSLDRRVTHGHLALIRVEEPEVPAEGRAPVRETVELRREGLERAHRGRVTVGGDGEVMLLGPAFDAGGIRVDALYS